MGQVIGDTTGPRRLSATQPRRPYTPQNVLATLYRGLGIDLETTLPDHSGRPVICSTTARPIRS